MSSDVSVRADLATALRIAEAMRDEIRSHVGLSGLRLRIAREPMPLTIGLDDARAGSDAVLLFTISDQGRYLATVVLSDRDRPFYAQDDADAARAIADRYRPLLREWLGGSDPI